MSFLKDLFQYFKERKKWWLAPVIMLLLMIGFIMLIGNSSPIGAFIYSIF